MCLQLESLSLLRILSPSFIFSCKTIVSILHSWRQYLEWWEAFTCNDETSDKKLANCSPYFTALQYINNLKTKRALKRKVNLKNLKFIKKPIERFNLLKKIKMFTEPLTRALRSILIKHFFLAIGWGYLHDLSHTLLKRLKLLWAEIARQKRFGFYR